MRVERFASGFAENFGELGAGFVATESKIRFFAAIEPDDIGQKTDLRGRPFAVRAVHLPVNVPGINEQDRVGAAHPLTPALSPTGARERF